MKPIKSNQLRIGNLIQDRNGVIMRSVSIHYDGTVYCDFNGNEGDVWEFNDKNTCYGVKLTKERLLKCGFKDEGTHLQLNLSNNWCYEWFDNLLGFSLCKGRRGLCLGKIKYVHELQNLHHSLTGEELEVNM